MKIRNANVALALSALAGLALSATSASAAIIGTAGAATQIAPPPLCMPGTLVTPTLMCWDEAANRGFAGAADMINNPATNGTAIAGPIGGIYDSHFLHFEGIPGIVGVGGQVIFNNPIVAVMFNQPLLDASDAPLGAFGTAYPTGFPLRGVSAASFFSISGNVLTFQLTSTSFTNDIEQIRVLTQAPTPGATALLGLGGAMTLVRRRRTGA